MATRTRAILAALLLVGALLRTLGLGALPRGLHPDEAADAYEAWCLARTGHASDGRAWPVVFPHHGVDWVEGTYVWLEAPFVGRASDEDLEAACRLPAALAGTAAILATFFLGRRLGGERLGLLAAAFLAVEPWAVHHARFGERAALEPLLVASGLALAWRGLEADARGPGWAIAGGLVLGLAAANYPPARVVLPLVALGILATSDAGRARKLAFALPLGLVLLALAPWALSERGLLRARAIAATSPLEVAKSYFVHFTPRTLFSGDVGQGFAAKGSPPLLAVEGPLVLLGLARWLRAREPRTRARGRFLLVWLLAFPAAAALTRPAPNLLRAIFGLPLFALLAASGVEAIEDELARKGPAARRAVRAALAALVLASIATAAARYVLVFPTTTSAWAPYAGERERVAAMRGTVDLDRPNERALVDLYARERPRRWLSDTRVELRR